MQNYSLYCSIIIGVSLILLYIISIKKNKSKGSLQEAIIIFLSANGIVAGINVCILSIDKLLPISETDRTYVFIGGISVIWVSVTTLLKTFQDLSIKSNRSIGDIPGKSDASKILKTQNNNK